MRLRTWGRVCAFLLMAAAIEAHLGATVGSPVPELDGSSLSAGLGLLAAGVLIVRAGRRGR